MDGRRETGGVVFEALPLGRYEAFVGQPVADSLREVELTVDAQVVTVRT